LNCRGGTKSQDPAVRRRIGESDQKSLSAFFLFARPVFDGTTLGIGQRIVVLLFAHAELGLHPGFVVKHFPDRGRLIAAVFLVGEGLEGPVEGKRKGDRNGGGFLVSHAADRVTANMTGQENSILTGV
jgi:hypothetical protein